MKEYRSASQILFGFLPQQTVDLGRRIWKVKEWRNPIKQHIDPSILIQELRRLIAPWEAAKTDGGFAAQLWQGRPVAVYSLDRHNGVTVDAFPHAWECRSCSRVYFADQQKCVCGSTHLRQLQFVAYHKCGALKEPWVRSCPDHKQVRMVKHGTAALKDLEFRCPVCDRMLQRGLMGASCGCGYQPASLAYTVHRAAAVYTPRSIVVVNPASIESVRRLNEGAGPERALQWVLGGMGTKRYDEVGMTSEGLYRELVEKNKLSPALAKMMVEQAVAAGEVAAAAEAVQVPNKDAVQLEAVNIALAMDTSRVRISDLLAAVDHDGWSEPANLYRHQYPLWLEKVGLESVELVERFPVLTGVFGYTRGDATPGNSELKPFRMGANYVVYGDLNETEALFFRLKPSTVARWLALNGVVLDEWRDERSARVAILRAVQIPKPGEEASSESAGAKVLTLVHSFAHRVIRRAAVFAGIDRNALSELLVPHHLGFFVYAAARGDFVLGGLQAVFESELHELLKDVCMAEHRCPLDPGCQRGGGACMACLHLGEPSCRYYNRYLDRECLFGRHGFFRVPAGGGASTQREALPQRLRADDDEQAAGPAERNVEK